MTNIFLREQELSTNSMQFRMEQIIKKSKPDPEVFLKAAEFLGLKPEECGVVEDAYAGIDAAVSGHMTAIAIGDAAGYDKADYKLSTFKDLLDIAK